ncbi:uncharacterized protein LOC133184754 [Saccostrea echinata]|uniref:uncharacterized protein LOC133184754 n=1 Tax=Saccostrea echinata TaxID=191078 RepID=UPI002A81C5D0|nr:uncharacterized protein LOC133184754 [Saccostrea echinata]XP_061175809.1 uncharacterized protein LOC133184754 [Saccostrea echinata]
MSEGQGEVTPQKVYESVEDENYKRIKSQTTTLRQAPNIAGISSALGLAATTFTWYRFSASRLHNLTVALLLAPNMVITHIFTKFAYKHDVTLPITAGDLSDDHAIALSTGEQLVFGAALPIITASYPFLVVTWEQGKKSGLSLSKHVGKQMKKFLTEFSFRGNRRYYRVIGINVILQLGVGALLGYNQVVERNLVKDKIYKEKEILPEYQDLFLKETDFSEIGNSFDSIRFRLEEAFRRFFPPTE